MKNLLYSLTIFIGAFLLFQVQPILGKYLQPWFGSTSSVWTTCMMFFQCVLFLGYLYAHGISKLAKRLQLLSHTILLLLAIALGFFHLLQWNTAITPALTPLTTTAPPITQILLALLSGVGLPFLLLSANSSLIQYWKEQIGEKKNVYTLYSISNIGSLLSLLSYPLVIENYIPLTQQAHIWSIAFIGYAGLMIVCGGIMATSKKVPVEEEKPTRKIAVENTSVLRPITIAIILCLSAVGSMYMLAVTSQLTQDVSPIPFLWILPLALYLLTFIITYSRFSKAIEAWLVPAAFIGVALAGYMLLSRQTLPLMPQIAIMSGSLFLVCLFCHGTVYSIRPNAKQLTLFYVLISLGGALGGIFVNLAAPLLFPSYWELHLSLLMVMLFTVYFAFSKEDWWLHSFRYFTPVLVVVLCIVLFSAIAKEVKSAIHLSRNFYGRVRVDLETRGEGTQTINRYQLMHGDIIHGTQFSRTKYRYKPTAYFTEQSGIGRAIINHPTRQGNEPFRLGIIGEGIGTLSAYGRANDYVRFYELNPAIVEIAEPGNPWFTYLSDCRATVDIVLGDGRLSLEQELSNNDAQNFDVLVVDVFNGDAIPAHLLTSNAFDIYLSHLKENGILAWHATNKYIDFLPLAKALAKEFNLTLTAIRSPGDGKITQPALWILMSRNPDAFTHRAFKQGSIDFFGVEPITVWTDDYTPLWRLMR